MTLEPWLVPLPDAEQMRAIDRWAIDEQGIPSLELMERAGSGLATLTTEIAPDGLVVVVCGKGNNGGDGLVVARLLREQHREVRCLLVGGRDDLRGDAAAMAEGVATEPFDSASLDGAAVVVDAILGTGFEGEARGPAAAAIAAMNGHLVVSADVPSGVDASTGAIAGAAVRARATATFAAPKPGLYVQPGKSHAGEPRVIDIGIPRGAPGEAMAGLIDDAVLRVIPRRRGDTTKFSSGHVVVAGGSRGLTGAPVLASTAAMRAGAGYVTCCAPESQQPVLAAHLLEVMTRALPEADGAHTAAGAEQVLAAAERGGALVVGPGLGRTPGAQTFAREIVRRSQVPLVLDADGLNAHAERLDEIQRGGAAAVLTPHAGELGRLLGRPSADIEAHRLASARRAAELAGAIVVLKGDDTIVARPDGFAAISPGATPALATAGTGDVLSGVIGALLAKELDPFTAACAGVRLHARAGLLAAERQRGPDGVIASDVIAALPLALAG
ncbi:MAG: ADP-dependent NAD(P)H-hydrate dehydratase / NAD(P)H-hydrate epimerase [Solirubrobacteraceae bacterium]|nr:ADP-dependent NAD(P)H-hydrate dehydratase / NAD(P)H-hydrate epimerase [Solirubrobacteraceae bacterium]